MSVMEKALTLATVLLLGCGTKVDPHSASAAKHEEHAAGHEAEAKRHERYYDPSASDVVERCGRLPPTAACWYSVYNPTSEHLAAAKKHREEAAAHRKASLALREAEAKACVGLTDDDRDMSPFHHREDIARVEIVHVGGKEAAARIVFLPVKGLTAQWLQRVVDCHLARAAALGHDVPEMPYCPLVPKGARAKVDATAEGVVVVVDADTPDQLAEVLLRAKRLIAK